MSSNKEGYVFTLGPELLKKANKELNEKDKHRKRDIQVLRERVLANKGGFILYLFFPNFSYQTRGDHIYPAVHEYLQLRVGDFPAFTQHNNLQSKFRYLTILFWIILNNWMNQNLHSPINCFCSMQLIHVEFCSLKPPKTSIVEFPNSMLITCFQCGINYYMEDNKHTLQNFC